MLLMPGFRGGQGEEDLAVLAGAALREIAVDAFLEAFVGQIALPPADGAAIGWFGLRLNRGMLVAHWSDSTRNPPVSSTLAQLLKCGLLSSRDLTGVLIG